VFFAGMASGIVPGAMPSMRTASAPTTLDVRHHGQPFFLGTHLRSLTPDKVAKAAKQLAIKAR
jgi:hypothetical protein